MFKKYHYPITARDIADVVNNCVTSFDSASYNFSNTSFKGAYDRTLDTSIWYTFWVRVGKSGKIYIGNYDGMHDDESAFDIGDADTSFEEWFDNMYKYYSPDGVLLEHELELDRRTFPTFLEGFDKWHNYNYMEWVDRWHGELEDAENLNNKAFRDLCDSFAEHININYQLYQAKVRFRIV